MAPPPTVHDTLLSSLIDWACAAAPPGFAVEGALADVHWPIPDPDRAHVARAVPSRQAEFVGGRWCAHAALARIGRPVPALPPGHLRAPIWPEGVVGSITHERGLCLAVVGHAQVCAGVGIDLCDLARHGTAHDLAPTILAPVEAHETPHLLQVFSAKEAVVKAISREMDRYLDLQEIVVRWAPSRDRFTASVAGRDWGMQGRQSTFAGLIVSFATLQLSEDAHR